MPNAQPAPQSYGNGLNSLVFDPRFISADADTQRKAMAGVSGDERFNKLDDTGTAKYISVHQQAVLSRQPGAMQTKPGGPVYNADTNPPPVPLVPGASAPARLAAGFSEQSGAPADIRDWPQAVAQLRKGPVPSSLDPTGGALNVAYNVGKGILGAHREVGATAIQKMQEPGLLHKATGAAEAAVSGIPVVGPGMVQAAEDIGSGQNVAGGYGRLAALGTQAAMGDPETVDAAASKLNQIPEAVSDARQAAAEHIAGPIVRKP